MGRLKSVISVVNYLNDSDISIRTWDGNNADVIAAENHFEELVKDDEPDITEDDLEIAIEDGMWDGREGFVALVWSL